MWGPKLPSRVCSWPRESLRTGPGHTGGGEAGKGLGAGSLAPGGGWDRTSRARAVVLATLRARTGRGVRAGPPGAAAL